MNKCIFIGRLTKDTTTTSTNTTTVTRFNLAVDRAFKREGEQTADFIPCVAFGKTAEFAEKYLNKGIKVAVEGRWQTGSYTNKDGNKVYTNDCIVERVEFCESKKESAPKQDDDFMAIDDIDSQIPFK